MAQSQITPVTILAGESLTDSVDASIGEAAYVLMPGEWDGANLTFQISFDNVTFWDLFDAHGEEFMCACKPGVAVRIGPGLQQIGYLKIRSGTSDNPIEQSGNRNFKVAFSSGGPPTQRRAGRPW